jgi:FkbM family methyltransferase
MYQPHHIGAAFSACRKRRTAIDVGAHVGFWSYFLAGQFASVHAFEPVPLFRSCFAANVLQGNVTLHPYALGRATMTCTLNVDEANSGATHVSAVGQGSVAIRALDDFELDGVDFIKVDVEGYERFVLEGAWDTLTRCRPVVIVEEKEFGARYGLGAGAPGEYLGSLGFQPVAKVVKDTIFVWPE